MITIAICDDSINDRLAVKNWLLSNAKSVNPNNIHEFNSGEALLEYMRLHDIDIVFLDCRMEGGINGIETARRIRNRNKLTKIIAITGHEKYALLGYDAGIDSFILKADFKERAAHVFHRLITELEMQADQFYIAKTINGKVRIPISGIVFIESELAYKVFHMIEDTKHRIVSKMSDLEAYFSKHGFLLPHNSFLINKKWIRSFNKHQIVMMNNKVIPIARSHRLIYEKLMKDFI